MMSFYGFIGGIGDGLADTGKMMQTDALEARRQQRLDEARMRQEQRANTEWSRRQDTTRGFALEDRDDDRAFKYGSENLDAVTEQGSFGYEQGAKEAADIAAEKRSNAHDFAKLDRTHSNAVALTQLKNDAEKTEAGNKPTESYRKYVEMMALGSTHEEAFATAYSDYFVLTDPQFGGSQVLGKGGLDVRGRTSVTYGPDGRPTGLEFSATQPGLIGGGPESQDLPKPKTREEMMQLPPGTRFQAPDGSFGVRP